MIKIKQLLKLMNSDPEKIKGLHTEQLRVILGTLRYVVRLLERELNSRFKDQPLGNIPQNHPF